MERRLAEAAALGFSTAIVPRAAIQRLPAPEGVELLGAETVRTLVRLGLAGKPTPAALED
jgi:predicted ATP-dependent serine protease